MTDYTACTEKEWDSGVAEGKALNEVRKRMSYTTGDEFKYVYARTRTGKLRKLSEGELQGKTGNDLQRYYHWLESGEVRKIFETSAVLCADLASKAAQIGSRKPAHRVHEGVNERSNRRRAVVMPILDAKRWKPGRWASETGIGKNSVYEYLNGKREKITAENRQAMAESLGVMPSGLPD